MDSLESLLLAYLGPDTFGDKALKQLIHWDVSMWKLKGCVGGHSGLLSVILCINKDFELSAVIIKLTHL